MSSKQTRFLPRLNTDDDAGELSPEPSSSGHLRDGAGRFLPGTAPGPGRPRGKSRATLLAETFLSVLDKLGGAEFVERYARENPGEFLRLVGKMLPNAVELSGMVDVDNRISVSEFLAELRKGRADGRDGHPRD